MTSKTERWLTWLMALVGVLGLCSILRVPAYIFAWFLLMICCRELIHEGGLMDAAAEIMESMIVFLPHGLLIITILVALGWITSRRVRIALWAFSMVLYGMMAALGVASTIASLSQHVSATTVAMDCMITMGLVVITMISVSLLRQAVASGRTPNSAVTLP